MIGEWSLPNDVSQAQYLRHQQALFPYVIWNRSSEVEVDEEDFSEYDIAKSSIDSLGKPKLWVKF